MDQHNRPDDVIVVEGEEEEEEEEKIKVRLGGRR
jgi:hypothetical protein